MNNLVNQVKKNLMITFNDDDDVINGFTSAAITYAEGYQHKPAGYYQTHEMSTTTEQGIIILASHLYESRDGSTGGYFNDNVSAGKESWETAERLLRLDRDWMV